MSNTVETLLQWDAEGEKLFETGVDRGVLWPYNPTQKKYDNGVAWNGLTGVTLSPSGAEETALYADNGKYLSLLSAEELGLTITAYDSPDEFDECDGTAEVASGVSFTQQKRKMFAFCWRTRIGNDTEDSDYGYKLHFVWGCKASPSERAYATINDSPDAMELSWDVNTTPVQVAGFKPVAHCEIESTKVDATKLATLEAQIYGTPASGSTEAVESTLPMPADIITMFK
jgi:hypothetical protein